MSFKRINNITGWLVCIIACAVYIMTMEATGSLWDCGEFASSAYKLQIPHPPGAPLFALIGRIFMSPFDPQHAATGINLMSALASGFTILFLFWSITHFGRKIVTKNGAELTSEKIFAVMAAGVVGALAYTFSDSFWYSAVEGEVYAMSSFFTAIVFWAILKWEQSVDEEEAQGIRGHFTRADRWIIVLFYLVGLGVGVHLLMILTIPAVVMVYYYKRYKVTNWGVFWAFLTACIITGFIQKAVIQWTIKGAGNFDILFVNSFGMPFFSGFAFFFVLLAVLIYVGLRIAKAKNWNFLKLGLWSSAFMVLGCFSSYFTTMVRSNADPSVDMYNVDNPVNLVGYLSREQYGDWPILYGQDFTASPIDSKITETYIKSNGKYEKNGRKIEYTYAAEDMHLFPRMWDQSNDQNHADYYAGWMGLDQNANGSFKRGPNGKYMRNGSEEDAKPTMAENIGFAFSYQLGWMYLRYFMWNFAGKQNDLQGVYMGNVRDGNWKTGIGLWDRLRLGDQNTMPDSLKKNKANNNLYALPLILGLLGFVYQVKKDKRDAFIVGLLFLLTGAAIVFYLNQAGNQPRERDYAFVGSFYAFAIWIGLGVLYVKDLFGKFIKAPATAGYVAAGLCTLAVPVIMANQEWDDHDRSHKTLARDLAIDYLESCDKNAIVISFGDNDTYPLWYAQEVEGIRRDIRVINSSLLGTDWYINELRYKVNESDPIDPIWTANQIEGSNRDVIYAPERIYGNNAAMLNDYKARSGANKLEANQAMDLYTMMKDFAGSDDPTKVEKGTDGDILNIFPSRKVFIPVDVNFVKQNGTVNATDSVVSEVVFEIPKNMIFKNDAAVLNIIAANKWKRPIYFTSERAGDIGIDRYIRQDGLTYRFVPVLNSQVNNDWVYDKMMKKFQFGNANVMGVYFDEENRRHLNSIRLAYAQAASSLADNGPEGKEKARNMLNKCDKMMLDENFPYGMVSRGQQHNYFSLLMMQAAYKADDTVLAAKIYKSVKTDLEQTATYLNELPEGKQENMVQEMQSVQQMQMMMMQIKNPRPVMPPPGDITPPIDVKPVAPNAKAAADTSKKKK
ncbi:glycosyltransferase family 117 protein [Ferruginibacter sp. SUN106]|uniref:glycosyltransferase family 117 protein n=1 Tax=Ferruginibacter sp. SUN106 TaxID=2978348 RepID=UPI003D360433